MFKKALVLGLCGAFLNLCFSTPAFAGTKDEKEARFAESLKAKIAKLGIGKDARVEVKLKDGTKIKGYITVVSEDSFSVMNERTKSETRIPYAQTQQAKKSKKTLAIVGIIVGVVVVVALVTAASRD